MNSKIKSKYIESIKIRIASKSKTIFESNNLCNLASECYTVTLQKNKLHISDSDWKNSDTAYFIVTYKDGIEEYVKTTCA
ncbi:MAG: hypothetical protein MJ089_08010 [Ruminococcus sp.]|nr:hypothetical protein [Ruminococcus sp.]